MLSSDVVAKCHLTEERTVALIALLLYTGTYKHAESFYETTNLNGIRAWSEALTTVNFRMLAKIRHGGESLWAKFALVFAGRMSALLVII